MAGIPRKRPAVVKKNYGPYKKLNQIRGDGRWIPTALAAVTTSPALASKLEGPKAHRPLRYGKYDRRLKGFSFRITRDDGTVIDHTLMGGISIWQPNKTYPETVRDYVGAARGYNPDAYPEDVQYWTYDENSGVWSYEKQEWNYVYRFKYNTRTQIWTVPFFDFDETATIKVRKGKIFWARFLVEDSITAIYKRPIPQGDHARYVYKQSEWWQEEDKLNPKLYNVRVPYFKQISAEHEWASQNVYDGYGKYTITVESSIDLLVTYRTYGTQSASFFGVWYGYGYLESCSGDTCAECQEKADDLGPRICGGYPWPLAFAANVQVTTEHGDNASGISNVLPEVQHVVTAIPYEVYKYTATIDCTYIGNMAYNYIVNSCSGGPLTYPLDFYQFTIGLFAKVEVDDE